MKQLILGGPRTIKKTMAERLAHSSGMSVIYIATANAALNDSAMDRRIRHHRQRRPDTWQTVEAPVQLAQQLQHHATGQHCLLVDCLTLWLSNCLLDSDAGLWAQQRQQLLDGIAELPGELILVSNEVGSGVVPLGEINRRFVDEAGFLHQAVAALCDRVIFTAAGLPLVMKGQALAVDIARQQPAGSPL